MKGNLKTIILTLSFLTFSPPAMVDDVIHLDVDGDFGDGGDTLWAVPGDTLLVDVWFTGFENCPEYFSMNVTLCNLAGNLAFHNYIDAIGDPWSITPPFALGAYCWLMNATDFTFSSPRLPPVLHGTAAYLASEDNSIGMVSVDPINSGYFSACFSEGFPSAGDAITVITSASTATRGSSWGDVKALFR